MHSRIIIFFFIFLSAFSPLSAQIIRDIGRINDNGLRVRSDWDLNAEIIGQLNEGDLVEILELSADTEKIGSMNSRWYKIRTPEHLGWVYGYYVDLYKEAVFKNFRLCFDRKLMQSLEAAERNTYQDPMMGITYPEQTVFSAAGYILPETKETERRIILYRIPESGITPITQNSVPKAETVNLLKQIIQTQPGNIRKNDIPVLPRTPARQVFLSCPEILENEHTRGIRCLTYYSQSLFWPPPKRVLFLYQGLSRNDSCWISAFFPVERPDLPVDALPKPAPDEVYSYFRTLEEELENADPEKFLPPLSQLEKMMLSLDTQFVQKN